MASGIWILKGDPLEGDTTVSYFFFETKLALGNGQRVDFRRNVAKCSPDLLEILFHDFFVEVHWSGLNCDPIALSVMRELSPYLKWGANPPVPRYVQQREFTELRNRMRFDRKWNVKLDRK